LYMFIQCEETVMKMLRDVTILPISSHDYTFHLRPIHANPNPEMTQHTAAIPKVPLKHSDP
jgi:hypothetical protein